MTQMALPPFSRNAYCAKCGGRSIGATFHAQHECVHREYAAHPEEHMMRTCLMCGYSWREAPLDASGPPHSDAWYREAGRRRAASDIRMDEAGQAQRREGG